MGGGSRYEDDFWEYVAIYYATGTGVCLVVIGNAGMVFDFSYRSNEAMLISGFDEVVSIVE
jgi:hypothetical protein